jgi:NitT/TauT family transport system permease protein
VSEEAVRIWGTERLLWHAGITGMEVVVGFILGSLLATIGYSVLTWAKLAAIRRSFMMTVRRLSGLK